MNVKFENYFTEEKLTDIFSKYIVKSNTRGIDGISMSQFKPKLRDEIEIIQRKVSKQTYQVSRYRQVLVPKDAYSAPRTLSIPTVRDKLALRATFEYMKEKFPDLVIQPKVTDVIFDVRRKIESDKYDAFIKLDIKSFFPSINHARMMEVLGKYNLEPAALYILERMLYACRGEDQSSESTHDRNGLPQGLAISSFLGSLFMSNIDAKYNEGNRCSYYRYVDDILILCKKDDVNTLWQEINNDVYELGMECHPLKAGSDKSSMGSLESGFQFIGHLVKDRKLSVRKSTEIKQYENINRAFLTHFKYKEEKDLDYFYCRLNLKVTGLIIGRMRYGWLHYFLNITDNKILFQFDAFIKKCCKDYGVPYDKTKIKLFSRAFYEARKSSPGLYIPYIDDKQKNTEESYYICGKNKFNLDDLVSELKDEEPTY